EQVESELWMEVRGCMAKSKWPWPQSNLTDLTMPGGSRAFGLSTNNPGNFHGFHGRYVLIVVDEAAEIKAEIFSALKGIMAGGEVHIVYLMNPTEPTGPSVDLFNDPTVTPFTVDGLYTPNMEGYHIYEDPDLNTPDRDPDWDHNLLALPDTPLNQCELDADPRPYLIRRRFIKDRYLEAIRQFGSIKPEWIDWWTRVRGLPPKEAVS